MKSLGKINREIILKQKRKKYPDLSFDMRIPLQKYLLFRSVVREGESYSRDTTNL